MGISKIWVFGEATEAGATASTLEMLTRARDLADTVEVVMSGDAGSVAGPLGVHGATTVHTIGDIEGALAGPRVASAIASAVEAGSGPDVLLCATSYDGRDVAGRLSARIDRPVITNVVDLVVDGDRLLGCEPVFGGTTDVTTGFTDDGLAIFLVRPKSFTAEESGGGLADVAELAVGELGNTGAATVRERFVEESSGPKLDEAAVVVSGGRGLGDPEKYEMIEALAKLVKGARLIEYPGAPHGITDTHKDRLNQDLLDFVRQ